MSSDAQAETLDHQRAWAESMARDRGWRLSRTIEGVSSGKTGPRKLVQQLLEDLRGLKAERRPQWLLLLRLDRIGRGSAVEGQLVLQTLVDLGVRVWTRDGGEERVDSAMDELKSFVKLTVGRHENDVRREKARAVFARKRAAGVAIGNRRAYGLKLDKSGRDVADGGRAKAVRLAFSLRAEGLGYLKIAERLAAMAPSQQFRNGKTAPVRWTPTRVKRLLENPAYVGPVVTEVQFHAAQRVGRELAQRHPQRKYPWPLSGALRCYCGRAMVGMCSGPKDYRIRYYACRATWAHGGKTRVVRADALESAFIAILRKLKAKPALLVAYRQRTSADSLADLLRAAKRAQAELSSIERDRENAWGLHARGLIRDEDLQPRLDILAKKRDAAAARVAALTDQVAAAKARAAERVDIRSILERAAQIYPKAKPETQRGIAREIALRAGGLCVDEHGQLVIRRVEDPGRQRKRGSYGR